MDQQSKEIAIGSATCIVGYDLAARLPIVIVDRGAAAAQALVDSTLANQSFIHWHVLLGTPPERIIELLEAQDAQHESRQYGIVRVRREPATHTGILNGAYAGSVSGQSGAMLYGIQGNVITGAAVIDAIEQAVLTAPGGLPQKLMAGMEAAREKGGDGRCSCDPVNPTACGAPPASFEKSAHIGFMIVTRTGDTSGMCSQATGCAAGEYFMRINIANQTADDADPVLQLRSRFDEFFDALIGRPDAVSTAVSFTPTVMDGAGVQNGTMKIELRDHRGDFVTTGVSSVTVEHAPGSAGIASIGPVSDLGSGVFQVPLSGEPRSGTDLFRVIVDDGARPVTLIPPPSLLWWVPADGDRDGDVDYADHAAMNVCLAGPAPSVEPACAPSDVDSDERVTLRDHAALQIAFTDAPCVDLMVEDLPPQSYVRCYYPFSLRASVIAEPAARIQWFLDDVPIPGATAETHEVLEATNSDLGIYRVEVTNSCGTVSSNEVIVESLRDCP